jgi:hypothetical protein
MSPRWNWDSPTPLAASECALHPGPKGGGAHSPAAKGVGESQFQRLEKRLALCLLCGEIHPVFSLSIDTHLQDVVNLKYRTGACLYVGTKVVIVFVNTLIGCLVNCQII